MMALIVGDGTNSVGEGQRVGEAREVEDPLEPGDAVAFHEVPVGDLALEFADLGIGHPRRVAAAGDAAFGGQYLHCATSRAPTASGPGLPPSPDRALRPAAATLYLPAWGLLVDQKGEIRLARGANVSIAASDAPDCRHMPVCSMRFGDGAHSGVKMRSRWATK